MARDKGLEELINGELQAVPRLTQKAMFGGWAWLVNGNLPLGARAASLLVRLREENEAWAFQIPGVIPMLMRERRMHGWVRTAPDVYRDDRLRPKLVKSALEFNRLLPRKAWDTTNARIASRPPSAPLPC